MEDNKHFTKNLFISFLIVFIFMIFWQMYVGKNMKNPQNKELPVSDTVNARSNMTRKGSSPSSSLSSGADTLSITDTLWDAHLFDVNTNHFNVRIAKLGTFYDVYLKKYNTHLLDTTFVRYFFTGYEPFSLRDTIFSLNDTNKNIVLYTQDSLKVKTFSFISDSYLVDFSYTNNRDSVASVEFYGNLYLNPLNLKEEKRVYSLVVKTKKGYKKYSVSKVIEKNESIALNLKDVEFVGIKSKYFMFVIVNNKHENGTLKFGAKSEKPYIDIIPDGDSVHFLVYQGPIEYFLLKKIGYGLFANYDFGGAIIAPFSMALLYILKFLHNFIPNWGWAIVVFALLMKIVFFPLTYKGLSSMRRMQKLKPEIDKLQKIYKNDPQKLQKEMMELYKKHNVNPFSGCLTLVVQLPIFWALYRILRMTIDLRGSAFIFWIKDLSMKDPYYILPILMGITSIIQSRLQQTGVQDNQSKMFTYFMPIFLVIIFISMPSGIVLYWFIYNLFSVFEALLIKRLEVS